MHRDAIPTTCLINSPGSLISHLTTAAPRHIHDSTQFLSSYLWIGVRLDMYETFCTPHHRGIDRDGLCRNSMGRVPLYLTSPCSGAQAREQGLGLKKSGRVPKSATHVSVLLRGSACTCPDPRSVVAGALRGAFVMGSSTYALRF